MPIERTAASIASRGETVTASNFDAGARASVLRSRMLRDDNKLGAHKSQHVDDSGRDIREERGVTSAAAHRQHCLTDTKPVPIDIRTGKKSSLRPVCR